MNLLQLYYTSCKQGRSSGSGFQVYSASDGLTEDEIVELERICMYVPPTNLPSQPTEEEIRNEFPIAFSYFRLQSGRYGVCQSVYVGKDYSDRFGNYFSHALILEEGPFPFAPILLHGSPLLRRGLTEAELETEQKPDPLPTINLKKPNGTITIENVQAFLEEKNRYSYLQQMLDGLIEQKGNPGSLVLAADDKDIPYWVAAIQLAFPLKLAKKLTFSTYVFDPDREESVVSVTPSEGSRFSFPDAMRRSDLYGFDFVTEAFGETPRPSAYSQKVVADKLEIESLKTFFNGFSLNQVNQELDSFLNLATFYTEKNSDITADQFRNAIQFAIDYTNSAQKTHQLLSEVSLEHLIMSCQDIDTATLITRFLTVCSNLTEASDQKGIAANFMLEKVNDFIANDFYLQDIQLFIDEQLASIQTTEAIRYQFMRDENLQYLQTDLLEMNNTEKDRFYLKFTIQLLNYEKIDWNVLTKIQKSFIVSLSKNILSSEALDFLTQDPILFAELSIALYTDSSTNKDEIIVCLTTVLAEMTNDKDWTNAYLNLVSKTKAGQTFTKSLFKNMQVNQSIDLLVELNEVTKQSRPFDISPIILQSADGLLQYGKSSLQDVAKMMKHTEIYAILHKSGKLKQLLYYNQNFIEFTDQAIESQMPYFEKFSNYYEEIKSTDNLYEIIVLTFKINEAKKKNSAKLEEALSNYLLQKKSTFNESVFYAYVTWSLPILVDLMYAKRKQNTELINAFMKTCPIIVLRALTAEQQEAKMKHRPDLFVDAFSALNKGVLDKETEQNLIEYLVNNEDSCKRIHELMKKQPTSQEKWDEIYQTVQSQTSSSLFGKFKNRFTSKK